MKIKEAFKKLETYNELAEVMKEEKKAIWFSDIISRCIWDGEKFADFASFRKYIRKEYIKELADKILESDDWVFNIEKEFVNSWGRSSVFELSLTSM